jgi:hypothetical protein
MPAILDDDDGSQDGSTLTQLPFPPVTKEHILNSSYHSWYPKYATEAGPPYCDGF